MRRRFIYPSDGSAPFEADTSYAPPPRVYIQGDIQPYRSMVTGEVIQSRSTHRDHLKAHGKIELGNEKFEPTRRPETTGIKEDLARAIQQLS